MDTGIEMATMLELIKMKNSSPEEYKKFLETYKEVTRDLIKMAKELADEMADELGG